MSLGHHGRQRRGFLRAAGPVVAWLVMGLGAAWTCPTARAQEGGPIVFGQQQKRNWLTLENTHAEADFLYRYQNDQTKPKTGEPEADFTENRFEETFTLSTGGYIYHPNLVELNLSGTFGLTQDSIDSTTQSEQQNGTVEEWDLNATILRKETTPLTLYSRRTRQLISRELGPTLDDTITSTGGILEIRSKDVPTRVEAFHSDQEQTGLGENTGNFTMSQNTVLWHSEARPTNNQLWSWDYTFNQVDQTTEGFGSDSFVINEAVLSHSLDFGKDRRSNLSSTVDYYNQTGDLPIERLHWTEVLQLHHTESFDTHYNYTLDRQSFENTDETTNRGVAGFTHRLYKSLVTNGEVGVQQVNRTDNANTFETFAHIDWDYRKKVPLGEFTGILGGGWDRQENEARRQLEHVLDQPETFSDPAPAIVTGNGIVPASVRITDATGLIVYQPGLDYNLRGFPDRLEIDRVIGGRIANGQTVLVDYSLLPQPGNTSTTTNFFIGGRYDIEEGPLKGLSLYTRYRRQDQTIDTSSTALITLTPDSYDDFVYGAEYRIWHLTATAEQEYYNATISPFDSTRFELRYVERLKQETTLTMDANYQTILYKQESNRIDLLTVSGQLQHSFTRELWGYATVLYRDENDELRGPSRGWQEEVELQWQHRQTTVYALFRNNQLSTDFQDNTFQFLEVGIRRQW